MQKTLVKPHPKSPLTPHQSGYWVKKILWKTYYIGPCGATPEVALDEWKRTKDDLYASETPKPAGDSLNVKEGMNFFLCDRLNKLERGEIVQRTYEDYVTSCKHIVGTFGASTPVASLTSKHFASLRDSFTGVSPHTITNRVTRAKVAFNWLFDEEYIEKQIRFGSAFRKPPAMIMRKHRINQPKKLFRAVDLRLLASKASSQLAAMFLLGVDSGQRLNQFCGLAGVLVARLVAEVGAISGCLISDLLGCQDAYSTRWLLRLGPSFGTDSKDPRHRPLVCSGSS